MAEKRSPDWEPDGEPNIIYPIRTRPERRALTFRCERCGGEDTVRERVSCDPRWLCRDCAKLMRDRLETLLANMRDERLYPVPPVEDDDDGRDNITTIPHV